MNKKAASFQQLAQLSRYFFECVDSVDATDKVQFKELNAALIAFRDFCQDYEQDEDEKDRVLYSCAFDLFLWLGLKRDELSMAKAQGEKIKGDYLEIFTV